MTAPHWLGLYGVILGAWGILWLWAAPRGDWTTLLIDLCRATPDAAGPVAILAMWLLMSAAMMLPTALPAFATFDEIADSQNVPDGWQLVAGYAVIWIGFAVLISGVQLVLPVQQSPINASVLLLLAGLYQFTPLKEACLSKCRQPLTFFMGHWDEGPWRMGLRLGAVCLGCCWALMALALIGGAMSLGFMALATVLMSLEKLSRGKLIPGLIAFACLAMAGFVLGGVS